MNADELQRNIAEIHRHIETRLETLDEQIANINRSIEFEKNNRRNRVGRYKRIRDAFLADKSSLRRIQSLLPKPGEMEHARNDGVLSKIETESLRGKWECEYCHTVNELAAGALPGGKE